MKVSSRLPGALALAVLTSGVGVLACGSEPTPPGNGNGPTTGSGGSRAGSGGRGAAAGQGGSATTPGTGGSSSGTGGSAGSPAAGGAAGGGAGAPGTGGAPGSGGMPGTDAMPGPGGPTTTDWVHSKVITLDTTSTGANVAEDVAKYPLAVMLDKTRFDFTQSQANGADIRFFDSTGKALPHHIELWDREAGAAAIWVLLDVVKGNSKDQTITMKWGHGTAPDISDSKAVFKKEDGFVGVWHLNEDGNTTADGYKDASSHEAHGTGVGMVPGSRVNARIGKGVHLENPTGQDTARWIKVEGEKATQFNPGPPITASLWVMGNSYPIYSYETMMSKGDTSWTLQKVRYSSGQGYQSCVRTPGYHLCAYNFGRQPLVTKQWLHVVLVLQEPRMTIYINGQLNASANAGPWNKGAHPLGIGNQTQALGGRRQWDGLIDEARVMQVARTAAWVKLEFESQKESPTLLKFGESKTQSP
jgi:biopolymer transport protein ExbB